MAVIFDVAVIGAGAAGMMAASVAGQRGLSVVLIDHAKKLGEKIRISGGGRCNFTNTGASPANFLSQNPHFCKSALDSYTPADFLALVEKYGIAWHEKHKGQLFCDDSSESIIQLLRQECALGGVTWRMPCAVQAIQYIDANGYTLQTESGVIRAAQLVIATGGMALPQVGATDFSLSTARQFGLKVIEPRPALVPLSFDAALWREFSPLSGVSLEVELSTSAAASKMAFLEDLLFTHIGLSGPGILQISSYWQPTQAIQIDLAPTLDLAQQLIAAKSGNKQQLGNFLSTLWPKRLVEKWISAAQALPAGVVEQRMADIPDKVLRQLAQALHSWSLVPTGTAGYKKAEVMSGGVDTKGLNQKTMASRQQPTLYFIGEAVDVTGWLGGYNFQWAWSSGVACGRALQRGG